MKLDSQIAFNHGAVLVGRVCVLFVANHLDNLQFRFRDYAKTKSIARKTKNKIRFKLTRFVYSRLL
jgi:hypothetical protein